MFKNSLARIAALFVLCCVLSACAGQKFDDPLLLEQAIQAAQAKELEHRAGGARPARVSAAISPASASVMQILKGDMAFLALYRNYPEGDTRFVLSMPQGTRMGSCVRDSSGKVKFQSISAVSPVSGLVRSSFAALDNFFASAILPGDAWHLQRGDVYGGVKRSEVILLRHRSLGWGRYVNFIYDLSGRPLVYYKRGPQQKLEWKIIFRNEAEKTTYSFKYYHHDWLVNVEIMEVKP